jgi:hypothetical protein
VNPLLAGAAAAPTHGSLDAPLTQGFWGDGSLLGLAALYGLLMAMMQLTPRISFWLKDNSHSSKPKHLRFGEAVRSISGGLASGYVILLLIPEIKIFNEAIRDSFLDAYVLALLGLVIFKGLQHYCLRLVNQKSSAQQEWGFIQAKVMARSLEFKVSCGVFCVYASLVLLTLPFQFGHLAGSVAKLLYVITFALHLGFEMLGLFEQSERDFASLVPWTTGLSLTFALVLAAANVLPPWLVISGMAFLAGIIMLQVFRTELPVASESSFFWFGFGTAVFVLLHVYTQRLGAH